jgi:hypothetical protein
MFSQKWNCAALLFPKQNYNVPSPNFHIHVSVSDLYVPRIGLQPNRQTDPGNICINRSQTHECRNWEQGHTVSFLGIHNRIFGTVHGFVKLLQLCRYVCSSAQCKTTKTCKCFLVLLELSSPLPLPPLLAFICQASTRHTERSKTRRERKHSRCICWGRVRGWRLV